MPHSPATESAEDECRRSDHGPPTPAGFGRGRRWFFDGPYESGLQIASGLKPKIWVLRQTSLEDALQRQRGHERRGLALQNRCDNARRAGSVEGSLAR